MVGPPCYRRRMKKLSLLVDCSPVFCLSSVPSFPSNNTRPGRPDAGWKNVTLSYHRAISSHDRDPIGIYMIEKPCRMPAGDQLCFPHRDEMRLAPNVGTIHSAVRVSGDVLPVPVAASKIRRIQSISQFPWECASRAVHAPFGPTVSYLLRRVTRSGGT